jgi:hypothetical protein
LERGIPHRLRKEESDAEEKQKRKDGKVHVSVVREETSEHDGYGNSENGKKEEAAMKKARRFDASRYRRFGSDRRRAERKSRGSGATGAGRIVISTAGCMKAVRSMPGRTRLLVTATGVCSQAIREKCVVPLPLDAISSSLPGALSKLDGGYRFSASAVPLLSRQHDFHSLRIVKSLPSGRSWRCPSIFEFLFLRPALPSGVFEAWLPRVSRHMRREKT